MLIWIAFVLILAAPAFAFPPSVQSTAQTLSSVVVEPEVPIGETLGIHFHILNSTGGNVPKSPCTFDIQEFRDNETYTLQNYRVRPECFEPDFFAISGAGNDLPDPCYFQSDEGGVVSAALPITYELGYHVHPNNTMTGGYGNYQIHIHCGNKTSLNEEKNFTVIHAAEPTWINDQMWWAVDYHYQVFVYIILLMMIAIALYMFLSFVGVMH